MADFPTEAVPVDDAPPAAAPAAPEPAPAPPAEPQDVDESHAVDVQGGKYVPLGVLKGARQDAKAAKEQAAAYQQQLAQAQGQIAAFQQIQQAMQRPPVPTGPTPAEPDPELVELARSLDYLNPNHPTGLDLERAAKHQKLIERQAEKIAQRMLAPLQAQTAQERSAANFERAKALKLPGGSQIDPTTLTAIWQALPAEVTADPQQAMVATLTAAGMMSFAPKGPGLPPAPQAPAHPPLYTEPLGGQPSVRSVPLTDVERAVLQNRGLDEKKYREYTKNFRPGRPNVLEDD